MQDATKFGKILRGLMVNNNLSQDKLAKDLGVSPSILSNYITGKNAPTVDFLEKCVNRFKLEKEEMAELFMSAFHTAAMNNNKIILDTHYIKSNRFEEYSKFLAVLLLYPTTNIYDTQSKPIEHLWSHIHDFYEELKTVAKFPINNP